MFLLALVAVCAWARLLPRTPFSSSLPLLSSSSGRFLLLFLLNFLVSLCFYCCFYVAAFAVVFVFTVVVIWCCFVAVVVITVVVGDSVLLYHYCQTAQVTVVVVVFAIAVVVLVLFLVLVLVLHTLLIFIATLVKQIGIKCVSAAAALRAEQGP